MSEFPLSLWFLILGGLIDLSIRAVAGSRRKSIPWILPIWTKAPRYADDRLHRIDKRLITIAIPVGFTAILIGFGLMVSGELTSGSVLFGFGYLIAMSRTFFLEYCLAFAERADAPAPPIAT